MNRLSLCLPLRFFVGLIVGMIGCKTSANTNCGIPDERVSRVFNELEHRAKIEKSVPIYSEPKTKKGDNIIFYTGVWTEKDHSGSISVKIGREYARLFSDEALSYILAHELGHVVLNHLQKARVRNGKLDSEQEKIFQKEADEFADKLVGKRAHEVFLTEKLVVLR